MSFKGDVKYCILKLRKILQICLRRFVNFDPDLEQLHSHHL